MKIPPGQAYAGTWNILGQTPLGSGAGPLMMDLSGEKELLVISEDIWVAKTGDTASDWNSAKLSLSVSGSAWTSTILSKNGECENATGSNYKGTWSVNNGKLTWTMNNWVSWTAERL